MTEPFPTAPTDNFQGLAIHTATGQMGLALQQGSNLYRYQTWSLDRQLLNQLHNCLGEFFPVSQWSELSYLAVAQGPGSFTSVRIGIVTARTLAQQLQIPLFSISTLEGFAQSLVNGSTNDGQLLGITMKATRGYLYGAVYQVQGENLITLDGDRVWLPEDWDNFVADKQVDNVYSAPEELGFTAPQLLTLAWQKWLNGDRPHWSEAQPFYGMSPTD